MSKLSDVNPITTNPNEKIDEEMWQSAQDTFDFIYGSEINEEIVYHICKASSLKDKKRIAIRKIYDQKMKEKRTR